MSRPVATSFEEKFREIVKDVAMLKRRGRPSDAPPGVTGAYREALLPGSYAGPGPVASVTFLDDGSTLAGPFQWLTPYISGGPRVVNMLLSDGGYLIAGHSGDPLLGAWQSLPLVATLGSNNVDGGGLPVWSIGPSDTAMVSRSPIGIVSVTGLMRAKSAIAAFTNLGTLPVGFRPDTRTMFPAQIGDVTAAIFVEPNGAIVNNSAIAAGAFISLDDIMFPAAGVATWIPVGTGGFAYANGWSGYNTAVYGVPACWKDPYGVVWWRGMLTGGTVTGGTSMISGPANYRAPVAYQQHIGATSNGVFGGLGSTSASTMEIKAGTNVWISLGGATVVTADALAALSWRIPSNYNGWVANSVANQATLQVARRPDGIVMSIGLMRAGTIGTRALVLPDDYSPRMRIIKTTISADARGRLDVTGRGTWDAPSTSPPGVMLAAQGSNAWFSFDNMKWVPTP